MLAGAARLRRESVSDEPSGVRIERCVHGQLNDGRRATERVKIFGLLFGFSGEF